MSYKFLEHTGDTAVEIHAADEVELFRDGARALLDILVDQEHGKPVEKKKTLPLRLEAEDAESLLVDYLNELIFLFDSRSFLCVDVDCEQVRIEKPSQIVATLRGESFDPERHHSLTEVKAATFHDMEIHKTPAGLWTTLVFDL